MSIPIGQGGAVGGPPGWSYAGVLVRASREALLPLLGQLRATGWLGPDENGWVVVVGGVPRGPVAAAGRDVAALAAEVSHRLGCVALAAAVEDDRVLRLGGWQGGEELGRYVSDASVDAEDPEEVFPEPEGAWHAGAYARACGRPEVSGELREVLAEVLDADSVIESERLARVLALLGAPTWLVSAPSLPRPVPGGPGPSEMTRLGSGHTGVKGRLVGGLTGAVRRRRRFSH